MKQYLFVFWGFGGPRALGAGPGPRARTNFGAQGPGPGPRSTKLKKDYKIIVPFLNNSGHLQVSLPIY